MRVCSKPSLLLLLHQHHVGWLPIRHALPQHSWRFIPSCLICKLRGRPPQPAGGRRGHSAWGTWATHVTSTACCSVWLTHRHSPTTAFSISIPHSVNDSFQKSAFCRSLLLQPFVLALLYGFWASRRKLEPYVVLQFCSTYLGFVAAICYCTLYVFWASSKKL
jgi:hypothetical protein